MIKLRSVLAQQLQTVYRKRQLQQSRNITALYITGDKAKDNYVTLQPFMDFENTLMNRNQLAFSIAQRKSNINLDSVLDKYIEYKNINERLKQLEKERELVATKLKTLEKTAKTTATGVESAALREHGKELRQTLKSLKQSFYPIEDDFIHAFLNLPNCLHPDCPSGGTDKLLYRSVTLRSEQGDCHLKRKNLINFMDNSRYYMMQEAAEFDVYSTQALTRYFVHDAGFTQTANPDFVRCVLLEANATPLENYHMVVEQHLQNKLNAAYLTGGGAFESFLGAMTKLCVFPSVLPLRYVCMGRSYQKVDNANFETNLFTATQSNVVQTFVATTSASEAHEQMDNILNLAVNFYQVLGLHFRIIYADASNLTPSESLRAEIEVYSPAQKRYICVGRISNYTDFVSKRILFTMRQQKNYHFLHIVGGPVMYTTRLIAALIENDIPLEYRKLLGAFTPEEQDNQTTQKAIDEFKSIFK